MIFSGDGSVDRVGEVVPWVEQFVALYTHAVAVVVDSPWRKKSKIRTSRFRELVPLRLQSYKR